MVEPLSQEVQQPESAGCYSNLMPGLLLAAGRILGLLLLGVSAAGFRLARHCIVRLGQLLAPRALSLDTIFGRISTLAWSCWISFSCSVVGQSIGTEMNGSAAASVGRSLIPACGLVLAAAGLLPLSI